MANCNQVRTRQKNLRFYVPLIAHDLMILFYSQSLIAAKFGSFTNKKEKPTRQKNNF